MKPIIAENFTDNGEHSHWSVIDANTGKMIIKDIIKIGNKCPLYVDYKKSCVAFKDRRKELKI